MASSMAGHEHEEPVEAMRDLTAKLASDALKLRGPTLLPELARMPGHLFWRAAARVNQTLGEVLPAGRDMYSYAALLALADGSSRSQQDIARSIGTSRTTMARVAGDLSAAGLVERVRNPEDRRSYALTRTPAGLVAAQDWQQLAVELEEGLTGGLAPAEIEELRELLTLVAGPDLEPDTPTQLRVDIGFLLHQIHLHLHPRLLAALEPLRIEPRHFGSLTALRATGPVSQGELARLMGVSGASMVQIVDDLEERGLVERRRAETDRRAQLLTLRPETHDVLRRSKAIATRLHQEQLAPLTDEQVDRLVELLGRFVAPA